MNVETLYHGTSRLHAQEILIEEALKVSRSKTARSVILKIDAQKATREGIGIEKTTDEVYVVDPIPTKFPSVYDGSLCGVPDEGSQRGPSSEADSTQRRRDPTANTNG